MHSIRSVKAYYIAAFVLGAIIALLVAAPARSAEPIGVVSSARDTLPLVPGLTTQDS